MADQSTLAQTQAALQSRGLDRLDAQLLLLHVLEMAPAQRGWLLSHDTNTLSGAQLHRLDALAQRRLAGEPLAYLTGSKSFYGLDLQVNAHVLVPRPDTETLVDWALEVLPVGLAHVLDLGTGSGAIALALKARCGALKVWATDRSADALTQARANAQRLHLDVQFLQGNWLDALPADAAPLDLIVSNPPYIAAGDPHLGDLRFEPELALTSGTDGLDDLRQIISQAAPHLQPGGWLLLEHGYDQAEQVCALLQAAHFERVQSRRDLAGIQRCSGGRRPPA